MEKINEHSQNSQFMNTIQSIANTKGAFIIYDKGDGEIDPRDR